VTASFTQRALTATAIALTLAALLFLLWQGLEVFLLLFAGILFGLFLSAIADWLADHTPLPRGVALALVVVTLVGLLALALWLKGPSIAEQADELREQLPRAIERLRQQIGEYELGRRALDQIPRANDVLSDRGSILSRATGVVSGVMGVLTNLFVVLLFGIFVAAEPHTYVNGITRLVAVHRRSRVRAVLSEAGTVVRKWLLSKVLRMIFIGVATWIALRALGVPVAFLLAVFAALLTFVPNFGPIIAAIPAVLLALVQGIDTALWVVLLYVAIQFVEGNVLDPLLTKEIVAIPPALTFGSQILLGVLVGPIGLAVATPLTAAAVVLVKRLYVEDVLGNAADENGRDDDRSRHESTAKGDSP
jgi:predicted PurR-regulated permease PerM